MSQYDQLLKACIQVILDYTEEVSPPNAALPPLTDYESLPGDTLVTRLTERIDALDPAHTDRIPFLKYITYFLARCWDDKNEIWSESAYQDIHGLCSQFLSNIVLLMKQSNTVMHQIIYADTTISVSGFLNGWVVSSTSKTRLGMILQLCLEQENLLTLIEEAQTDRGNLSKLTHNLLQLHQFPIIKAAHTANQTELEQLRSAQQTTESEASDLVQKNKQLSLEIQNLQTRLSRLLAGKEALPWSGLGSSFFARVRTDLASEETEQHVDLGLLATSVDL